MKRLVSTSILVLGSMMSLFADSGEAAAVASQDPCCPKPCPPKPCCVPVCCPEIVEDCCAYYHCPPTTQVTPNVVPNVKGGANLFITAAFTWWSAHEDGLAFANVEPNYGDFAATVPAGFRAGTTTTAVPNFKWKPGFKVGAGLNFCHDGWDLYFDYTWFRSTDNSRSLSVDLDGFNNISDGYWLVNGPYAQNILPTFPLYRIGLYESASANWSVKWNVFDLELGRNFYISRRLKLRPHFGLKGMFARQTLDVNFNVFEAAGLAATSSMNNHIKNWGIGVRAGLDTSWQFCECFSLIGEISATGLWEQFKVSRVDQTQFFLTTDFGAGNVFGTAGSIPSSVNYQSNLYFLRPVVEWFLGLRWEMWTCEESFHFEFDAGWETQVWFSQNQFLRIQCLEADHGDLSLQGLTLRARFDF